MDRVVFESVRKVFRHRPALFNWLGRERSGDTVALRDLSFSARAGEVLVLLGPNGSGKTTALKLVSTMLLPDAALLRIAGFRTQRDGAPARPHMHITTPTRPPDFRGSGRRGGPYSPSAERGTACRSTHPQRRKHGRTPGFLLPHDRRSG